MPIGTTLPVTAADATKSIVGQKIYFGFLENGGSQEDILVDVASLTPNVEKLERDKVNTTSGLIENDRTVVTKVKWTLRITSDEMTANMLAYYNDPYRVGTGRIWIEDPDDATDTVSLLSNEFNCTCSPDGDSTFQRDQFSEFAVMVEIQGALTFTQDSDVS